MRQGMLDMLDTSLHSASRSAVIDRVNPLIELQPHRKRTAVAALCYAFHDEHAAKCTVVADKDGRR
jgi:hypothetical protein